MAPAGQRPLPLQTPNSNAPICSIDVDASELGLTDAQGQPLSGQLRVQGFITPAWRYLFGALLGGASATGAIAGTNAAVRPQRSITMIANLPVTATDSILNVNAPSDLTPIVPLASTRAGAPLTFKNLPGSHSQTLKRTSPDLFDGSVSIVLVAGASVTLVPYNDGVNTGYSVQ